MLEPNLFIVGAGKSGTTSLYHYLNQHPQIFMSEVKEPHYFCTDLHINHPYSPFSRYTSEASYLKLFQDAAGETLIGEASPTYLISQVAARNIFEFNPQSQIIAILRNPVEMVYSAYYQWRFGQLEPLQTFEEALDAQEARAEGKLLPRNLRVHPSLYQYYDNANYAAQIQRYWNLFPKEQVKIIIYDDFKNNTAGIVDDIFRFLQIESHTINDLHTYNRSKTFKNQLLQSLLHEPPQWLVTASKVVQPIAKPLYYKLQSMNIKVEKRPEMSPETKTMLQDYFKPQIDQLSQMLACDLSHWYQD